MIWSTTKHNKTLQVDRFQRRLSLALNGKATLKIDEIKKEESDFMHAFFIENILLGRDGAVEVVKTIPGATILETPRFLSWFREDIFCKFEVNGVPFEIEEPYGDNSLYWVGKSPEGGACPELEEVANAFRQHSPTKRLQRKTFTAVEVVLCLFGVFIVCATIWRFITGEPVAI